MELTRDVGRLSPRLSTNPGRAGFLHVTFDDGTRIEEIGGHVNAARGGWFPRGVHPQSLQARLRHPQHPRRAPGVGKASRPRAFAGAAHPA